jgi:hypothetical protein
MHSVASKMASIGGGFLSAIAWQELVCVRAEN